MYHISRYGYVCRDIGKEFSRFDESGTKFKLAPDGVTEIGYEVSSVKTKSF